MTRKVVVTGLSALTPIGNGLQAFGEGLRLGLDGVREIEGWNASRHRVRHAAEVRWDKPEGSSYSRATEMALATLEDAVADAGLDRASLDAARTGVILSSNQGGMAPSVERYRELTAPYRRGAVPDGRVLRVLDGSPTATLDLLMHRMGARGLSLNVSTACSAGLHALGMAYDAIRMDEADVVVVAGVEVLTEPAQAGFSVLRALSNNARVRPFDEQRDGTLLGEGAAAIVVERDDRARARGAKVWAEIAGYGSSTDAYHMTRPLSEGAVRAMQEALAGTPHQDVDWIKAHGTATPANDVAEATAIQAVFPERQVPVTSIKSQLGHSLGASGVTEAVGVLLAMHGEFIPRTLHLEKLDKACPLDVVAGEARPSKARVVLANAFGFGGNNAAICFKRTTL